VNNLEISHIYIYSVNITNQFQTTFAQGGPGGGEVNLLIEVTVNSKEDNS
jgi:hypothetical protein